MILYIREWYPIGVRLSMHEARRSYHRSSIMIEDRLVSYPHVFLIAFLILSTHVLITISQSALACSESKYFVIHYYRDKVRLTMNDARTWIHPWLPIGGSSTAPHISHWPISIAVNPIHLKHKHPDLVLAKGTRDCYKSQSTLTRGRRLVTIAP